MIDADGPVHVHRADIRSVAEALLMVAPNEDFRLGVIALAHGLGVKLNFAPGEAARLPANPLMHHLCKEQSVK